MKTSTLKLKNRMLQVAILTAFKTESNYNSRK